jgi:predicted O-methyltransferase YrrM
MREFLRLISTDSDFITTVSDVGDGVSVSYKKEKEA